MTSHVRAQIRAAAVGVLRAAAIVAADSVMPGRRRPTSQASLPALLVFTDDEQSVRAAANAGVAVRQRQVQLVVRIRAASAGEPSQDALDALAAAVESALDADTGLGGLLADLELTRTESGAPSPMSDRELGEVDVIYLAEYFTDAGNPTAALT